MWELPLSCHLWALRLAPSQEILEKFTARQLRLAFLTQLWTAKVDFSESLMTGEVRNLEITINVRIKISPLFYCFNCNTEFFHNGESPCPSSKWRRNGFRWTSSLWTTRTGTAIWVRGPIAVETRSDATTSVYTRASLLSERHFAIRSILQWQLTFFAMSSHGQMFT